MIHWLWYTLPAMGMPGLYRTLSGPIPTVTPLPTVNRVTAVAAHPDDLEYFCGGTLGEFICTGAHVTAVVATSGEAGGDPTRRKAEQQRAAAIIGYDTVRFLHFPDGGVQANDRSLLETLSSVLQTERPDLLLTFDSEHPFLLYRHADHLAIGDAIAQIWQGPTLLFHSRRPTVAIDVTTSMPNKVEAFVAHESQMPRTGATRLVEYHLRRQSYRHGRYVELFREVPKSLGVAPAEAKECSPGLCRPGERSLHGAPPTVGQLS